MSPETTPPPTIAFSLAIKIAPPKVRRIAAPKSWLTRLCGQMDDHSVVVVQAPAGFGKTTLLSDWRRNCLAHGALAGWLTLEERDDGPRFLSSLVASLRSATGNPRFGSTVRYATEVAGGELDAMTTLLAEVIELSRPVVLILDDVHLLPEAVAHELLSYLMHNLPPNLQLVFGTREPLRVPTAELLARGELAWLKPANLRLRVEETIEFLHARLEGRIDVDACARVHELADGWPIALQLAATVLERDPASGVAAISGGSRDIGQFFTETVLALLPHEEADFLIACSVLDMLHPDLCAAMTGVEHTADVLRKFQRATPVLTEGEGTEWLRMHPLARTAFAERFNAWPAQRQAGLHWRAAQWLHDHGDPEAAARHALASGRPATAYEWVGEECFTLLKNGRMAEILAWAERLPPEVMDLPLVRLAIAWAQTLSYQPAAGLQTVLPLASAQDRDLRMHVAMIRAATAIYADDAEAAEQFLEPWQAEVMPTGELRIGQVYANELSYVMLWRGELEQLRYVQAVARQAEPQDLLDLSTGHGAYVIALSYLQEAKPRLAEQAAKPVMERLEAKGGRRGVIPCFLASCLAAAYWEQGRLAEVEPTLAYRIDVVERTGPPDSVLLTYLVLARSAAVGGNPSRAVDLLQRLQSLGEHRRQPRLTMASLLEQIRLNAAGGRAESAAVLSERMDACLVKAGVAPTGRLGARLSLLRQRGRAQAELAGGRVDEARAALLEARGLAKQLNRVHDWLEARVLLAMLSDPEDSETTASLRESLSIAETNACVRLFADAHPRVIAMVRDFALRQGPEGAGASAAFIESVVGSGAAGARKASLLPKPEVPALLTAKEASVLDLLAQGMSNKEIARAIDVGHETVKWHLKNLFGKLNAGSRRHAVDRARTLGLIA
jgi:LuxR family maltose regulon positive regulatory protein